MSEIQQFKLTRELKTGAPIFAGTDWDTYYVRHSDHVAALSDLKRVAVQMKYALSIANGSTPRPLYEAAIAAAQKAGIE